MKIIKLLFFVSMLFTFSNAQNTTLKLQYNIFDFDNSKKKDQGKTKSMVLKHHTINSIYTIAYDKTHTNTFKPPLTQDLCVNKYYLKYQYKINKNQAYSISYANIDDNIMQEVDNGKIYGIGFTHNNYNIAQYLSDYNNFNVYQTDLKYNFKKVFSNIKTKIVLMGKYIHLQNKDSNDFSKNANETYFTPGINIHANYQNYYITTGAFFGKRIFAVMNDGLKVQHHAMEFEETYMFRLGKHIKNKQNMTIGLKYVYQKASEIPINHENVKVNSLSLELVYKF